MHGSYGLVMFVFGLLVTAAHRLDHAFIPVNWLPTIHLVLAFGAAWTSVAVLVRMARAILAMPNGD